VLAQLVLVPALARAAEQAGRLRFFPFSPHAFDIKHGRKNLCILEHMAIDNRRFPFLFGAGQNKQAPAAFATLSVAKRHKQPDFGTNLLPVLLDAADLASRVKDAAQTITLMVRANLQHSDLAQPTIS
jgi:hypothetical protein